MKETKAVVVKNLTIGYHGKAVLENISFDIQKGCMAAIVGPNGGGKSTLMKGMLGLIKPMAGEITFPAITKQGVGYVPQNGSVDWDFPVDALEVVMMGRYRQLGWCRRPKKRDEALAYEALASLGMADFAKKQISQLSGGQQQRVFLARALLQNPELYLMDEPLKGVDVQSQTLLFQALHREIERGKTVVLVHHDLQTIPKHFDWVTFIKGEVIANGRQEEVFTPQNIAKTYGTPCWESGT